MTVLVRLSAVDGTADAWERQWKAQCDRVEEEFELFAPSAMDVLRELANHPTNDAAVYALRDGGGEYLFVAQMNAAHLPKYDGRVLRVRHMVACPDIDFGEHDIEYYGQVLSALFSHTLSVADGELDCRHVKFHFRSPTDRQVVSAAASYMGGTHKFRSVQIRGAWLYISFK